MTPAKIAGDFRLSIGGHWALHSLGCGVGDSHGVRLCRLLSCLSKVGSLFRGCHGILMRIPDLRSRLTDQLCLPRTAKTDR